MIPLVTVNYGALERQASTRIPQWTLPFLVQLGGKIKASSGNSNLKLVRGSKDVSLQNRSENATSEEANSERGSLTDILNLLDEGEADAE